MAFDGTKPDDAASPAVGPTNIRDNQNQIKKVIQGGHQFNDTTPVPDTDGYHTLTRWTNQAGVVGAVANTLQVYARTVGATQVLYSTNSAGVESPITGWPTRAGVTFDNNGNILSSFNIAGVVKNSQGVYTITFTTAMPSANYAVLMGAQYSLASGIHGEVYSGGQLAASVKVRFVNDAAAVTDGGIHSVVCMGG